MPPSFTESRSPSTTAVAGPTNPDPYKLVARWSLPYRNPETSPLPVRLRIGRFGFGDDDNDDERASTILVLTLTLTKVAAARSQQEHAAICLGYSMISR